jgi:hypothetical protein
MTDRQWRHFYNDVHTIGLTHLRLLESTAVSLRDAMSDSHDSEQRLEAVQHLCALSQNMYAWAQYLIPKGSPSVQLCDACEAAADEEED